MGTLRRLTFLRTFLVIAVFAVLATSCGQKVKVGEEELTVGAILPLTGPLAFLGEMERASLVATAATINARDGVKGRKVQLIIEDCKSQTAAGVTAAKKLLEIDRVDILYTDLTDVAMALVPLADQHQIPLFATAYAKELLTNSPNTFRNLPTAEQEAQALLDHVNRDATPVNAFGILVSNDEFGNTSYEEVRALIESRGGKVVVVERMEEGTTRLRDVAAKGVAAQPEAVYISSLSSSLGLAVRELRTLGYTGLIITTDLFPYSDIYEAAADAANGVIYADFIVQRESDEYQHFLTEFSKILPNRQPSPNALLASEALATMVNLVGIADSIDAESIVQASEGYQRTGLLGRVRIQSRQFYYTIEVKVWGQG